MTTTPIRTAEPEVGVADALASGRRRNGQRLGALLLLASVIVSFLAGSSAPTPLYGVYASKWHFSAVTTTIVFAVYAAAVLIALLGFGRVSDHIGRKPVLVTALLLQTATMIVFATADGLDALLVGRVIQGIATGGAVGALGAAMVDIHRQRGTLANAVAPTLGVGVGALLSSLFVQYLPAPTRLIYVVLMGVFVVQAVGVALMPDTVERKAGVLASLKPEAAIPRHLRRAFLAAAPAVFAVWAVMGFYGSLAPSLARQLSGSTSIVVGGLSLFALAISGSLATLALDRMRPHAVMTTGIVMLILGALCILISVEESSTAGFFVGTVAAGIGFGGGFQGAIRTVVPLAEPHERAGVLSVVFVVAYFGMAGPAVVAGLLTVYAGGLKRTAIEYAAVVIVLAAAAFVGLVRHRRTQSPGSGDSRA